jgi:hypothetical protein
MARLDMPRLTFQAEFKETYFGRGALRSMTSTLISPAMPKGMGAQISPHYRSYRLRTKAVGKGSIRYRDFDSYEEAQAAALRWLQRKVREAAKAGEVG